MVVIFIFHCWHDSYIREAMADDAPLRFCNHLNLVENTQMSKQTLNPGEKAPVSGQYQNPKTKTEVTAVEGKPSPPTPGKGQGYKLVDPTKHKNK